MASRIDLDLEQKVSLIMDQQRGSSYRELKNKFQISLGAVSNILKRKHEYLNDYESNQNKRFKRKIKDQRGQVINDTVYDWFVLQRSKRIPISGPILQEYAKKVAAEIGDDSGLKRVMVGWSASDHATISGLELFLVKLQR